MYSPDWPLLHFNGVYWTLKVTNKKKVRVIYPNSCIPCKCCSKIAFFISSSINTRYTYWISDNLTYKKFNKLITVRVDCGEVSLEVWMVIKFVLIIQNHMSYGQIYTYNLSEIYNVTSPFNQWRYSWCLKTSINIFKYIICVRSYV